MCYHHRGLYQCDGTRDNSSSSCPRSSSPSRNIPQRILHKMLWRKITLNKLIIIINTRSSCAPVLSRRSSRRSSWSSLSLYIKSSYRSRYTLLNKVITGLSLSLLPLSDHYQLKLILIQFTH